MSESVVKGRASSPQAARAPGQRIRELLFRVFGADPSDVKMLRRIVAEHGVRHLRAYSISFACGVVVAICVSATAYLAGRLVDRAYQHHSFAALAAVCGALVFLSAVKGIAAYRQTTEFARVANAITAELQQRMFNHLLTKRLEAFDRRSSISFLDEINIGATSGSLVIGALLAGVGRDLLSLVGLVGVVIWQAPWLSLLGIAVVPLILLTIRNAARPLPRRISEHFAARRHALELMSEAIRGLGTIKAFSAEDTTRARIRGEIEGVREHADGVARLSAATKPAVELLASLAGCVVFLYGGYRVMIAGDSPGAYLSLAMSSLLAFSPAKRLANLKSNRAEMLQGLRVLFGFLDDAGVEHETPGLPELSIPRGEVRFDDVRFAYRGGQAVLRGVGFSAAPGRVTAIVGPSGGGKSTILNLLLRLYEPQSGTISIDGQPIESVSLASLRSGITLVSQDPFLFSDTIEANIRFGCDASDEAVRAAGVAAAADGFIMRMPAGYHTRIGALSAPLSAGERQRISIARALLRDARIILLDEPTASLDAEADRDVRRAMARLSQGRTTIIVAHRLNTIIEADAIYVLEDGLIVEGGTHADLLASGQRYASLYSAMFESAS